MTYKVLDWGRPAAKVVWHCAFRHRTHVIKNREYFTIISACAKRCCTNIQLVHIGLLDPRTSSIMSVPWMSSTMLRRWREEGRMRRMRKDDALEMRVADWTELSTGEGCWNPAACRQTRRHQPPTGFRSVQWNDHWPLVVFRSVFFFKR